MKHAKHSCARRLLAGVVAAAMLLPAGWTAMARQEREGAGIRADATVEKELRLWYDEPAPDTDDGWEKWSIPLGCGYLGANVFGRTDSERIQLTENSLCDSDGGLSNFSETYLDFGHDFSQVTGYTRDLLLNDSTAHVQYEYDGVTYAREYFTSYPDEVMALRLSASEAGKLSFTLRPTIPFLNNKKTGSVNAQGDTITLAGHFSGYEVEYEGQFKVIPTGDGAQMEAHNDSNGDNGTIAVTGADSAVILIALGTNYQIDSQVFLNGTGDKLKGFEHPHAKVTERIRAASEQTYEQLRINHLADYTSLFDRVRFDLGGEVPAVPTDELLDGYKAGGTSRYLEELYFQFGRYLLISSSRKGALPPNLQGVWNRYEHAPWTGGYWHNINIQMNYWPVFNTNLAELFDSYVDFYNAYLPAVENSSDRFIRSDHPDNYDPDGDNGWSIGTGANPYSVYAPNGRGTDGNGTGALMAKSFWEYYDFTRDPDVLEQITYPAVSGSANFMSRVMEPHGDVMLADPSASPEQMVDGSYYPTVGSAWDQELAYEVEKDTLRAAQLLGKQEEALPARLQEQIDKLDPIQIGFSGQIKEFREENFYGEIAEYNHRHISQLVGLYPGTLINSTTPAWMDAAKVSLNLRGDKSTGWAMAHRLNAWARTKDGNRTYSIYQTLLKNGTLNNLWDTHPPFQIDGNFGGTSGVSEMLLQSHEGYIAPLSSIPDDWTDGSYRGLVARGNFEVGADWSDGQADRFVITSNAGGTCALGYYNIASATVTDSKGAVAFTSDGTDQISFETTAGETYTVTGIPPYRATQQPSSLGLGYADNGKTVLMSWTGSPDAASYNVYRADGNAPDYILLQSGVTDTQFVARDEQLDQRQQHTFRITAVSSDGRESAGCTAIMYPLAAPKSAQGALLDDTTVQISIDPVASAESYNIYRKSGDRYEKLLSTKYCTAVVEGISPDDEFAVSVESETRESDKTDVTVTTQYEFDNVLLNKPISGTRTTIDGFPLTNAVDGDTGTRYAVSDIEGPYSVTIDLGGLFELRNLQILEFQNPPGETRSNETTIELSSDGGATWTTIVNKQPLNGTNKWMDKTEFNLGGASGSLIRFTFHHTIGTVKDAASIHELICSGAITAPVNKKALQEVLFRADAIDTSSYDPSAVSAFEQSRQRAAELFNNPAAGQQPVDEAAAELATRIQNLREVNAALNKPVTVSHDALGEPYAAALMVDGDHSTRYAGSDSFTELEVEIDLQGDYLLSRVSVDEYLDGGTRGGETTVDVFDGSQWVTVIDKQPLSNKRLTSFDFDATMGSKIRFRFQNTQSQRLITIYEIEVLGIPQLETAALEQTLVQAKKIAGSPYTPESFEKLQNAIAAADFALAHAASQQEVDEAHKRLQDALDGLVPLVAPDKTILQRVIEKAEELAQSDEFIGAIGSVQASFTAVLNEAREVNRKASSTQQQVDAAWIALMTEIHKLGFQKGDLSALTLLRDFAAGLRLEDYIDNQAKADLPDAVETANAVLIDPDAMADTIQPATQKLLDVLAGLRMRADKTLLTSMLEQAEQVDETAYTPASLEPLRSAVAEAKRVYDDPNAVQEEADAAAQAIEIALDGLVSRQAAPLAAGTALSSASTAAPATGDTLPMAVSVLTLLGAALALGLGKKRR